jgi:hypothetical protein
MISVIFTFYFLVKWLIPLQRKGFNPRWIIVRQPRKKWGDVQELGLLLNHAGVGK